MFVITNNPPCKPNPLVTTPKEEISNTIEYSKTIIATLLYKIAKSRLVVTALDNKIKIIEVNII
jgi:hypothetical protein